MRSGRSANNRAHAARATRSASATMAGSSSVSTWRSRMSQRPSTITDSTSPAWPWCTKHETGRRDRKSTRLNSSHITISYAVFCLKKKKNLLAREQIDACGGLIEDQQLGLGCHRACNEGADAL